MNNHSEAPQQIGLLSRYAENLFWMARYLERAENLARLLDVTMVFSAASRDEQNWQSILQLHSDADEYALYHPRVTQEGVIDFYLLEERNPNSIISCITQARSNASRLRAIISTEMWVQINVMYNYVRGLKSDVLHPQMITEIFAKIRRQCSTHNGIAEVTFYHDQGWHFYSVAKHLERADQTTRLLDIKYHLLLPQAFHVGSTIDNVQWLSVLRSVSGYHAFRRNHPDALSPANVAGFLIFGAYFPRSVIANIDGTLNALNTLHTEFGVDAVIEATKVTQALRDDLMRHTIEEIIGQGMHEYLDKVQLGLMQITDRLAKNIFYHSPVY